MVQHQHDDGEAKCTFYERARSFVNRYVITKALHLFHESAEGGWAAALSSAATEIAINSARGVKIAKKNTTKTEKEGLASNLFKCLLAALLLTWNVVPSPTI